MMRGIVLCSRILLFAMLVACFAGCGPAVQQLQADRPQNGQATSTATAPPLTSVDWANFTYFSSCYGNTQPFHTKNGQAINGLVHFYVYPPTYGNLTGNKQPDAVVPYQCSAADTWGVHAFVYSGTAQHPVLIGNLPLLDAQGTIENITRITISNGILQLEGTGYSANAPHCCPDLFIQTRYKWQGKAFTILQTVVRKK
jgi:hypothetical protein